MVRPPRTKIRVEGSGPPLHYHPSPIPPHVSHASQVFLPVSPRGFAQLAIEHQDRQKWRWFGPIGETPCAAGICCALAGSLRVISLVVFGDVLLLLLRLLLCSVVHAAGSALVARVVGFANWPLEARRGLRLTREFGFAWRPWRPWETRCAPLGTPWDDPGTTLKAAAIWGISCPCPMWRSPTAGRLGKSRERVLGILISAGDPKPPNPQLSLSRGLLSNPSILLFNQLSILGGRRLPLLPE